jgi:hypothetical protein
VAGRHIEGWSPESLEYLDACPVCGAHTGQAVLYRGLRDKVQASTPGAWDFYRCGACGSGYFNPRPTPESVGRLYEAYYTHAHADAPLEYAQLSLLGKLRRVLGNGYRNYRFGMRERPASMLGVLVSVADARPARAAGRWRTPPAQAALKDACSMSAAATATFCCSRSGRAGKRLAWSLTRKPSRSPARGG